MRLFSSPDLYIITFIHVISTFLSSVFSPLLFSAASFPSLFFCSFSFSSLRSFSIFAGFISALIYIIKGDMFVCLFVCSVWPAKRLGRSRRNFTHALTSTQGVFLARSMSRSFTYACESDRSTKHPQRCANTPRSYRTALALRPDDRTTAAATPSERLRNAVELRGD